MQLWHVWLGLMQHLLEMLAGSWGLGVAVILLTLMVRVALLPLTWTLALRAARRQAVLAQLASQLAGIRELYAQDPRTRAQKTLELYRDHGLTLVDHKSLAGAFLQLPIVWALYDVLRERAAGAATGFLWVRSLGKPDIALAILAAATTLIAMAVAPHLSEQARLGVMLLPAIVCFLVALHLSSGIALYWITSNLCGAAQSLALRQVLRAPRGPFPPR